MEGARSLKCIMGLFSILGTFLIQATHVAQRPDQARIELTCKQASYSLRDFDSGTTVVTAPNHLSRVLLAKDGSFRVLRADIEIGFVQLSDVSSNVEVAWAPDSRKFSITYSDGGAEGMVHAHAYQLTNTGIMELSKLPEIVFEEFKKHYYCTARGNNIYALGWTLDSMGLLFVTQVYPTSDCGEAFGRYGGYLVDLAGNIIRQYDDKQTEVIVAGCRKTGRRVLPLLSH